MISKLELKSSESAFGEKTQWYELDGITIMVSVSYNFRFIENVNRREEDKSVRTICFSNKNKPICQDIITSCLKFFGFNIKREMYIKCISFMDYSDREMVDCYCFEQLFENNKTNKNEV